MVIVTKNWLMVQPPKRSATMIWHPDYGVQIASTMSFSRQIPIQLKSGSVFGSDIPESNMDASSDILPLWHRALQPDSLGMLTLYKTAQQLLQEVGGFNHCRQQPTLACAHRVLPIFWCQPLAA